MGCQEIFVFCSWAAICHEEGIEEGDCIACKVRRLGASCEGIEWGGRILGFIILVEGEAFIIFGKGELELKIAKNCCARAF